MQSGMVSELRVVKRGGKRPSVPSERVTVSLENGGLPETYFRSLAERVAGHRLYQRGVFFQQLRDAFPSVPRMWTIDRFFPYSKHGPLYIDEPVMAHQVEESERKREILAKLGKRMVILAPKASFQDAMEQLSEAPACPGYSPQP